MKKYFFLLLLLSMISHVSSAYTFKKDKIYYTIDYKDCVYVTYENSYTTPSYSGNIIIPDEVEYGGQIYKVTKIGSYAFNNCTSVTSVKIGNNVTIIDNSAFYNCNSITDLEIGNKVEDIAAKAFYSCSNLNTLTLPNSLISLGNEAFEYCSSIQDIKFGNHIESIGEYAFRDCTSLSQVNLPESLKYIGHEAFCDAKNADFTFGASNMTISYDAFRRTAWYDKQPDGFVYIGNVCYCYKGYTTLGSAIYIKEGTTKIAERAFYGQSLGAVYFPNSLQEIGSFAFSNCNKLATINNTDHIKKVDYGAFNKTKWLENQSQGLVYIGKTLYCCKTSSPSDVTIKEGTLYICEGAFAYLSTLGSITLHNSVIGIGANAFLGCTGLKSITLSDNLQTIGKWAFTDCSISELNLPASITEIGEEAFDITSLKSVNIKDFDKFCQIDFDAHIFSESSYLLHHKLFINGVETKEMIFPEGMKKIPIGFFANFTEIESVTFPSTMQNIGYYAFRNCSNIREVNCLGTYPPKCSSTSDIFYSDIYNTATLYVPSGSNEAYQNANCWKKFTNYATRQTCETPIISENGDGINISCPTEGATIYWNISSETSGYGNTVYIPNKIVLKAYAIAEGYTRSEEITKEFSIGMVNTNGDIDGDGTITVSDISKLVNIILQK